jgi:RimJ/RimL family protein N-acetyltransferase
VRPVAPAVADDDELFRTERLVVVRRWRAADLEAYAELNADPEVMTFLGGPMTREASDGLARYGESSVADGLGLLPVVRAADGALLGMCGLHRHRWYPDEVEIGWRFARAAWGNGYAIEAARGWRDRAFGSLGLDHLISITDPGNHRSRAVMRRLGMHQREQTVQVDRVGREVAVVVYALAARPDAGDR